MIEEFSHTILHGENIAKRLTPARAPPSRPPSVPLVRPIQSPMIPLASPNQKELLPPLNEVLNLFLCHCQFFWVGEGKYYLKILAFYRFLLMGPSKIKHHNFTPFSAQKITAQNRLPKNKN